MPKRELYEQQKFANGLGRAAAAGHCSEVTCAKPIPLTDLWCSVHRKTGPWYVRTKDGLRLMPRTYEESEANHAARMREMIEKGRA